MPTFDAILCASGKVVDRRGRRAERVGELKRFAWDRAREQRVLETRQRILARQYLEELFLFVRAAILWLWDLGHAGTHIIPASDKHRQPRLPRTPRG